MRGYRAASALRADAAARDEYRRAPRPDGGSGDFPREQADRAVGFLIGAAAPFALAIQGGGYDIVAYEFTGLVIWWVIAAGLALGVLPRAHPPSTMRLPAVGLIALVAWTALSLAWTSSAEATFAELNRLIAYAGVALFAIITIHRGNWRAAAAGLTTAAVAVPLLALSSRLDPSLFAGTSATIVILGRLSYPLGYWNALGAWSVMALALAMGFSAHRAAPIGRRLALATTPALGVSVYLTYSRGALIGLVVALAALLVLSADRREVLVNAAIALAGSLAAILITATQPPIANGSGGQGGGLVLVALLALGAMCAAFADALARRRIGLAPWRRPALVAVLCAVVALVVGARALAPGSLPASAGSTQSTVQAPATHDPAARLTSLHSPRLVIWRQALDAFASNPLLGIGPGTFDTWWARREGNPPLADAHSLYLGTLAELGLPGFLVLAALVLGLVAAALQATRRGRFGRSVSAGLLGAALVFCVQAAGDWLWKVPAIVVLAAGALSVLIAQASEPRASGLRRGRSLGLAALAFTAGAMMIPGTVSTQLTRDSESLATAGNDSKAIDYAHAAVSAEPWSASARSTLALVQLAAGDLRAARGAAQRAIDLEPDNWFHRLVLGVIEFKVGDTGAALRAFREAAVLDSQNPAAVSVRFARREAQQITGPPQG